MQRQHRKEIDQRLNEIEAALAAINETKVTPVDPTTLEDCLLDEFDALEFELGIGHFSPTKNSRIP